MDAPRHCPGGPVSDGFARAVAAHDALLASVAARSADAGGRARPEPECSLRTPYQRDRDRIVHSKAFRRLKHKTQVFIAPEGDHYRTRLTHTLEVSGIARAVARALSLNEDLTEAIALGHDLGHSPFGHAGEEALSDELERRTGATFRHNQHSLRIVDVIEDLNLTAAVRDGIVNHTGPTAPQTLEGRIVKIVDRVAYINHDIDDAIRAGVLDPTALPADPMRLLGASASARVDTLAHDLVEASAVAGNDIVQTPERAEAMLALRSFMFEHVYLRADTADERRRIGHVVRELYAYYADVEPPAPTSPGDAIDVRVVDHIAGMTDRYALRAYRELFEPDAWRF